MGAEVPFYLGMGIFSFDTDAFQTTPTKAQMTIKYLSANLALPSLKKTQSMDTINCYVCKHPAFFV